MKSMFSLLVFLSAIFLAQAAAQTCRDQNPFISRLAGVTVFGQPVASTTTGCKSEWSKNGTCCDAISLAAYARSDKARIMASVASLNKVFENFHKTFLSLNFTAQRLAALQEFNWKGTGLVNATMEPKLVEIITKFNLDVIKRPIFTGMGIQDIANEFGPANLKCWSKMADLRNAALCSICSGKSAAFFWEKKANMDQATCDLVFGECWQSFKALNVLFTRLSGSGNLKSLEEEYGPQIIKVSNPQFLDYEKITKLVKLVNRNGNEGSYFITYIPEKENSANPAEAETYKLVRRTLCRKFVQLVGKTFLEMFDSVITEDQSLFSLGSLTSALVERHRQAIGDKAYTAMLDRRYAAYLASLNAQLKQYISSTVQQAVAEDSSIKLTLQDHPKKKVSVALAPIKAISNWVKAPFTLFGGRKLDTDEDSQDVNEFRFEQQVNIIFEDIWEPCMSQQDDDFLTMNLTLQFP